MQRMQVLVLSQSSSEEGGQPALLSSTPQAVARPLWPSPALDPPRGCTLFVVVVFVVVVAAAVLVFVVFVFWFLLIYVKVLA